MRSSKVLFVSGGIGLGHATRDLAVARELRRVMPGLSLTWLAGGEAREFIAAQGETMAPECALYSTGVEALEAAAGPFSLDLTSPAHLLKWRYLRELPRFYRGVRRNVSLFKSLSERDPFDLVLGDETYELAVAVTRNPRLKRAPFALVVDFVGVPAPARSKARTALASLLNRGWRSLLTREPPACDRILFVGEEADVPESCLSFLPEAERPRARDRLDCLGFILPFDASALPDRGELRVRLGIGGGRLVVCSAGGTTFGAPLLEMCGAAYDLLQAQRPNLRMILVCGPRLSPGVLVARPGLEVWGYVEKLYQLFAACDLAIVQGGGTTTLELTALRTPFLYFPLREHFEQEVCVSARLERHTAGVRMDFSETTPRSLAGAIEAHLGEAVLYPPVPVCGAQRAAEILAAMLALPRRGKGVRSRMGLTDRGRMVKTAISAKAGRRLPRLPLFTLGF